MSSLAQGLVDQHFPGGIKKIVCDQRNRYRLKQLSAYMLPAQPLLQLTKRKYYFAIRRNNLPVNDHVTSQRAKWLNQLRETMRDLVHRARVDRNSPRFDMRLRTNPIKLVFN